MLARLKSAIKGALAYRPPAETAEPRERIARAARPGYPFCPPDEGDFLHALIVGHGCKACLETGFGTGSTALYMLHATRAAQGRVTSIDWSADAFNRLGRELLAGAPDAARHRLIEEPSEQVLPRLALAGETFDFVFVDGWKFFDQLAFEAFLLNRMLPVGGIICYDDAANASVRAAIRLLQTYYGYVEVPRRAPGGEGRRRLFEVLTRRTWHRPYRALRKAVATEAQAARHDPYFFRPI
jgi:predicted O-methyltransferase YrrM